MLIYDNMICWSYLFFGAALDRYEISDLFQGMGMALSKSTIDSLMNKFDSNSDGCIDLNEFMLMLMTIKKDPKLLSKKEKDGFSWGSLGTKLRNAIGKDALGKARTVTRKLDIAFQMSDIAKIENIGLCHGNDFDQEFAKLTFAVYIRGVDNPLVLTCAKPGHVEAWMEAFRTCIAGLVSQQHQQQQQDPTRYFPERQSWGAYASRGCSSSFSIEPDDHPPSVVDYRSHSGFIEGAPEMPKEKKKVRNKANRTSLDKWRHSSIDWGLDDSDNISR